MHERGRGRFWHATRMARHRFLLSFTPLLIAAIAVAAAAQTAPRELLNSERIAAKFGSYGIAVLEQDDIVRVSNLFSGTGVDRVCRTFAVVRYAEHMDSAIDAEHAAVVAGGSIGAVFAAAGWEVRKTHLRYGPVAATQRLAALMHVPAGTSLAMHVYALDVVKAGRTVEYAALVEIHHPDYLSREQLIDIYGPADETARAALVAELLATADARANRNATP
jgi:hypothetical protein